MIWFPWWRWSTSTSLESYEHHFPLHFFSSTLSVSLYFFSRSLNRFSVFWYGSFTICQSLQWFLSVWLLFFVYVHVSVTYHHFLIHSFWYNHFRWSLFPFITYILVSSSILSCYDTLLFLVGWWRAALVTMNSRALIKQNARSRYGIEILFENTGKLICQKIFNYTALARVHSWTRIITSSFPYPIPTGIWRTKKRVTMTKKLRCGWGEKITKSLCTMFILCQWYTNAKEVFIKNLIVINHSLHLIHSQKGKLISALKRFLSARTRSNRGNNFTHILLFTLHSLIPVHMFAAMVSGIITIFLVP